MHLYDQIDFLLQYQMKEFDSPQSSISDGQTSTMSSIVKFVSPKKWKKFMVNVLDDMKLRQPHQNNLIIDLLTIVEAVSEPSFVEATLNIRPFKPEFIDTQKILTNRTMSTMAQTVTKAAHFKNQLTKMTEESKKFQKVTEETLKKQFNRSYHPFKFIIKNFCRLLQLKYKAKIDNKKADMQSILKNVRQDLKILTEFLKEASLPYRRIFKIDGQQQQQKAGDKLKSFITTYIQEEKKLHQTIKKIVLYAARALYEDLLKQKLKDFVTPQQFDMPEQFRIDGCYIRSINSLMEFSSGCDPEECLSNLGELRKNILKDLDDYYTSQTGESRQLEVCAQVQIEIIRFILAKLKGWACEIYGQLKFLQIIYGEDEIAYKFEQASFLYAQLSMAFEIQGVE